MTNYFEAVSIELNKAFEHFNDIDDYLHKVSETMHSGLLNTISKLSNVNEAIENINKNNFTLDIEKTFFLRILLDIFYEERLHSNSTIYDKLITRLELVFEENIKGKMILNLPKDLSNFNTCYSNGLIWEIEKVLKPKDENKILAEPTKIDNKNTSPIIWESNGILLFYLIQWLKDNNLISKKSPRDKIILEHFIDVNGNQFKNISQKLHNIKKHNYKNLPKNFNKIKPLLDALEEMKDDSIE